MKVSHPLPVFFPRQVLAKSNCNERFSMGFCASGLPFLITGHLHREKGCSGTVTGWLSLQDMFPAGKELRFPDAVLLFHLAHLNWAPRQRPHQVLSLSSWDSFIRLLPWISAYRQGFLLLAFASVCSQPLYTTLQEDSFRCIPVLPQDRGMEGFVTGSHQPRWAEGMG